MSDNPTITVPPVAVSVGLVTIDLPEDAVDVLLEARGWTIERLAGDRPDALIPPGGRGRLDGGSYEDGEYLLARSQALTAALLVDAARAASPLARLFASTEARS